MVSLARIVWGQAGALAVVKPEAPAGVQPSVRPFGLAASGAHSGLDAGASEQCNGENKNECQTNKTNPTEPEELT